MGDTPSGSSARLSGDLECSFERDRDRLEGMFILGSMWLNCSRIVDGY
jgi:hypothetical protein